MRSKLTLIGLLLVAVASLPLVACDSGASRSGQAADADSERPDSWVTSKVKTKLAADPDLNPFEIGVTTERGVVSLSGVVEEEGDKLAAERLARDTVGVREVVNNLRFEAPGAGEQFGARVGEAVDDAGQAVDEAGQAAGRAVDEAGQAVGRAVDEAGEAITDAAITAAVKGRLLAADDVAGLQIDVDTAEGVVVLAGRVATRDQKRRAEELALATDGVKRVVNELDVQG